MALRCEKKEAEDTLHERLQTRTMPDDVSTSGKYTHSQPQSQLHSLEHGQQVI